MEEREGGGKEKGRILSNDCQWRTWAICEPSRDEAVWASEEQQRKKEGARATKIVEGVH